MLASANEQDPLFDMAFNEESDADCSGRPSYTLGTAIAQGRPAHPTRRRARWPSAVSMPSRRHDSHGIIAIPTYIDRIKAGHIVPGAMDHPSRNRRPRP